MALRTLAALTSLGSIPPDWNLPFQPAAGEVEYPAHLDPSMKPVAP